MKSKFHLIYYVLLSLFLGCNESRETSSRDQVINDSDSLSIWMDNGKNSKLSKLERLENLSKVFSTIERIESDSLKNNYYSKLSLSYLGLRDSLQFRKANNKSIIYSKNLGDSIKLAESYWDLSLFFSRNNIKDSAYYNYKNAQKIFEAIENNFLSARMLYNMAVVQSDIKDYTGSEINLIKAVSLFKQLKNNRRLYSCYNLLGLITLELNEYDRAIEYNNIALTYLRKVTKSGRRTYQERTLNNIGWIYQEQEKYDLAVETFEEVFKSDSLIYKDPILYSTTLANSAYSKLQLGQTDDDVEFSINKAIKIKDSLQDYRGLSLNYYYLSQYFLTKKDTVAAITNAKTSMTFAKQSTNNKRLLEVLKLMPMIDKANALDYTQHYARLTDSLQIADRRTRDKFTRIQFETDEVEAKNVLLARQQQLLIGIVIGLVLLALSIYIIISQRIKNQKLKFLQSQQESNQEIFNLMLSQNQKLEEGKQIEQKRISEELHDGILGQMLGVRLILTGLNKKTDEASIGQRAEFIKKLQQLEEEVRTISHELNDASYQKIHNFISSIQDLITTINASAELNCEFTHDGGVDWDQLSGEVKINVYRIVQESIQNTIKHAQATYVKVNFAASEIGFSVTIADDGIGFETKKGKKGIGLKNIISRVHKINGALDIQSSPGNGTTISIETPGPELWNLKDPSILPPLKEGII